MKEVYEYVIEFSALGLMVFSIADTWAFNTGMERIVEKQRGWLRFFFLFIVLLGGETVLFSWLPGKAGCEISMMNGMFVFEDGLYIGNFGKMLLIEAFLIGGGFLKYIFSCIRGRRKPRGRLVLADLAFCAGFAAAGVRLVQDTRVFRLPGSEAAGEAVVCAVTAIGVGMLLWLVTDSFGSKAKTVGAG